ncbi:hypothetical protein ABLE91_00475 [Aquabacter sp. CN5-332]|uniref:hypothetical protein n=1 Tax=Aquabacter sp. CN5-332 TaxID=3156608 RepID=UPI0032B5032A
MTTPAKNAPAKFGPSERSKAPPSVPPHEEWSPGGTAGGATPPVPGENPPPPHKRGMAWREVKS